MKLLPLLGVASLACASACQSQGQYVNKHWDANYVGPSISRYFLDYNPQMDGDYGPFFDKEMGSIGLTLERHLFNNNPENPFQGEYKPAKPKPAPAPAPKESPETQH